MRRHRLRTSLGCCTCRRRKKKCDESKPKCKNCERLNLFCSYRQNILLDESQRDHSVTNSLVSLAGAADALEYADQVNLVWTENDSESTRVSASNAPDNDIVNVFASQRDRPLFDEGVLEHIVISGVTNGWSHLLLKFDIPQNVLTIDARLRATGHGTVARLVFIWYLFLLSTVRFTIILCADD